MVERVDGMSWLAPVLVSLIMSFHRFLEAKHELKYDQLVSTALHCWLEYVKIFCVETTSGAS